MRSAPSTAPDYIQHNGFMEFKCLMFARNHMNEFTVRMRGSRFGDMAFATISIFELFKYKREKFSSHLLAVRSPCDVYVIKLHSKIFSQVELTEIRYSSQDVEHIKCQLLEIQSIVAPLENCVHFRQTKLFPNRLAIHCYFAALHNSIYFFGLDY